MVKSFVCLAANPALLLVIYNLATMLLCFVLHSDADANREQFEDFFEEVYQELTKFGEISEMNVCDNLGDHLIGNVYVKVSVSACFILENHCNFVCVCSG